MVNKDVKKQLCCRGWLSFITRRIPLHHHDLHPSPEMSLDADEGRVMLRQELHFSEAKMFLRDARGADGIFRQSASFSVLGIIFNRKRLEMMPIHGKAPACQHHVCGSPVPQGVSSAKLALYICDPTRRRAQEPKRSNPSRSISPVSYTHLTLPTTPYV